MDGNTSGWEKPRDDIMEAGREICGETTGRFSRRKKTWWWNKTVQQRIKEKNEAYKKWQKSGEETVREACKHKKRQTKKEVANTVKSCWEEWQRSLSEPIKKAEGIRM